MGLITLRWNDFLVLVLTKRPSLSKPELNELLLLAQSDRERELVRYTAFRASGLSKSGARRQYGFQDLFERTAKVEECVQEAKCIRECIDSLVKVQENALLRSIGIIPSDDSSLSSNESDDEGDECPCETQDDSESGVVTLPTDDELIWILQKSKFNWFELVDRVMEKNCEENEQAVVLNLESFFEQVLSSDCSIREKTLLEQSYHAYYNDSNRRCLADREANALNGLIVTDSESEDPDHYVGSCDLADPKTQAFILKKRQTLRRHARYLRSKQIAERNFLARNVSHKVRGILKDFPEIGLEIEHFVQEANIGADAWRRTGTLTFDGNSRVKSKVTYERIRQHLMKTYRRNFAYGTVVQLCIARNRRRWSAKRYKGIAKVMSRRARKGFMLKYNLDAQWSAAMYCNLNYIQYKVG